MLCRFGTAGLAVLLQLTLWDMLQAKGLTVMIMLCAGMHGRHVEVKQVVTNRVRVGELLP